jgi:hypothetical protein
MYSWILAPKGDESQIEEVRLQYEREEKEAREKGLPPPDGSAIDFRTVEELKVALETQKAKLDSNMIQYEQRKYFAFVCFLRLICFAQIEKLEKAIAERKKRFKRDQECMSMPSHSNLIIRYYYSIFLG